MDFPAVNNAGSDNDEDWLEDFDGEDILMELSQADQQLLEALSWESTISLCQNYLQNFSSDLT